MTLDRVTELNMRLFMQLADLPVCPVSTSMHWQKEQFQTWLNWQEGRLHLSQCLAPERFDSTCLLRALQRWQPAFFSGIPQRFFQLSRGLVISCCLIPDSTAELWLRLHQRQQSFLTSVCTSQE